MTLTEYEIRSLLREACNAAGSQKAFAATARRSGMNAEKVVPLHIEIPNKTNRLKTLLSEYGDSLARVDGEED